MKRINITEARRLAEMAGADSVIVFAFTGDRFSTVSYGKTKALCAEAGHWLDRVVAELAAGALPGPHGPH